MSSRSTAAAGRFPPLREGKHTLLVFTLQIEVKDYPNFIVRNVIMDRLHFVLTAMRGEALSRMPHELPDQ